MVVLVEWKEARRVSGGVRVGQVNKGQFIQAVGVCLGIAVGWAKMDLLRHD